MKDINGKTLRRGDVCVVHFMAGTRRREKTPESFVGELCEVLWHCRGLEAYHSRIIRDEVSNVLYRQELEIIGDVRDEPKTKRS